MNKMTPGYYKYISKNKDVHYYRIKEVQYLDCRAAITVLITDWHSSGDLNAFFELGDAPPTDWNKNKLVTIGYTKAAQELLPILEEEYNEQLIKNLNACGRRNKNSDVFNIAFKPNKFRRGLVKYVMENW